MAPVKVFLDANVLFSAALGGASFALLWEIAASGKISLYSSRYCFIEASENLKRKRPAPLPLHTQQKQRVAAISENTAYLEWAAALVPEKDAPVLAAARGAEMEVLLTGDIRDFGALMQRDDLGIRVCTLRAFLLAPNS